MQTSIKSWDRKRVLLSLPDFWFLAILLLGFGDSIVAIFNGAWNMVHALLGIFLLISTLFLVKQLFRRKIVVSSIMGTIFLLCSLGFSLMLFSELSEFASLRESKAIELMLGGGIIVAGSIFMSVLMLTRNILSSK